MKLYENNKEAWDKLAANGFGDLRDAAKRFVNARDFDRSLGFSNACHHWLSGKPASVTSNLRARAWLAANPADATPATRLGEGLFLVVCPPEKADRVAKVLALLGCEFSEV